MSPVRAMRQGGANLWMQVWLPVQIILQSEMRRVRDVSGSALLRGPVAGVPWQRVVVPPLLYELHSTSARRTATEGSGRRSSESRRSPRKGAWHRTLRRRGGAHQVRGGAARGSRGDRKSWEHPEESKEHPEKIKGEQEPHEGEREQAPESEH